jgi:hypothetical protein
MVNIKNVQLACESFWFLVVCLFVFALWFQLTTFMEGVALWAHNLLFLLVSSYVHFHCYLLSSWWIMVFLHWIGSLDLVMVEKCGNADYKEQRSVLMEWGPFARES